MSLTHTYIENGHLIENDIVSFNDSLAWFKDSFKYHVGKKPNSDLVRVWKNHNKVTISLGYLTMEWSRH